MAGVLPLRIGCGFNAVSQFVSQFWQFWTASQFSVAGLDVFAWLLTTWRDVIQKYLALRRQIGLR
jgi:hypothetical protein